MRPRVRPGATRSSWHSAAAPDTDPAPRGPIRANPTRIRPRRAPVPSCVLIGGLRDRLRHFPPPTDLHSVLGVLGIVFPQRRLPGTSALQFHRQLRILPGYKIIGSSDISPSQYGNRKISAPNALIGGTQSGHARIIFLFWVKDDNI